VRSIIGNVLFVVVLLAAVGATWLWGPKFSVVLSQSMDPTYTTGDALVVLPWGKPGVGDIAQFRAPLVPGRPETTIPIAHRIIGQDDQGFITKGDNPINQPDIWRVTPDMVQGKVVFWMPQVLMFRIAAALIGFAVLMFMWPRRDALDAAGNLLGRGRHRRVADDDTTTQLALLPPVEESRVFSVSGGAS
jgi:signal peptidase I